MKIFKFFEEEWEATITTTNDVNRIAKIFSFEEDTLNSELNIHQTSVIPNSSKQIFFEKHKKIIHYNTFFELLNKPEIRNYYITDSHLYQHNKWQTILRFIKRDVNFIELPEYIHCERLNQYTDIHQYAKDKLQQNEFLFFDETEIQSTKKYISYKLFQKESSSPVLLIRYPADDIIFNKMLNFDMLASENLSDIILYDNDIATAWVDTWNFVALLSNSEVEMFEQSGIKFNLLKDQSSPTQPIDNFKDDSSIQPILKQLKSFGQAFNDYTIFRKENEFCLSNSDDPGLIMGTFLSYIFAISEYPNQEVIISRDRENYILIKNDEGEMKKIVVVAKTSFSNDTLLEPLDKGFEYDELWLFTFFRDIYTPTHFWIFQKEEITDSKLVVPNIYYDFPTDETFIGAKSQCFQFKQDLKDVIVTLMDKYE